MRTVETRERARLLAIPPEAASDEMSTLVRVGGGIFMQGGGGTDYLCGHCGRLLLLSVDPHSVRDVWFICPKCGWFNGMDVSLGWAQYVIEKLEERKLPLQRIEELLDEIEGLDDGSIEEFFERNDDAGAALRWLGKLSLGALVSILTLLYTIYAQHQNMDVAKQGLDVAKKELSIAEKQSTPHALSPQDIERIARALHRLQGEIQIKQPPRPQKRAGRVRKAKRGRRTR
jgi:hypothetical protein